MESARAAAAGRLDGAAPPSSLRALVRAALGGLPEDARALAEAVAAAGRGLSAAEVAALPGQPTGRTPNGACSTPGSLHRARRRPALPARAARRGRPRRPARPGGHAPGGRARGRGGRRAGAARAAEVAHHLRQAGRDDLAAPRWRQAARHARALGALPEATAFWAEAVRCDPDDGATRLELAEVHAWSGRTEEFEHEWAAALAARTPADAAAAWRRRGLLLKTVVCNPAASLAAYRRAAELLAPDAPAALRAQVLVGLAWNEGADGRPGPRTPLLAEVRELVAPSGRAGGASADELVAETESARLITLIRLGRFAECEAVAEAAGAAADRLRRPDLAYVIWIQTTCALTCAGDHEGALRTAERGIAATRDVAGASPCPASPRGRTCWPGCGRHGEAAEVVAELLATAGRLDSPPLLAVARHDAGLVALAAGRHARGGGPAARRARRRRRGQPAGRPAGGGRGAGVRGGPRTRPPPSSAAPRWSPSGPPTSRGRSCRGWRACRAWWRGPEATTPRPGGGSPRRRRAGDAAGAGWRGAPRSTWRRWSTSAGRPIVGLVEPDRELARVVAELAELEVGCRDTR